MYDLEKHIEELTKKHEAIQAIARGDVSAQNCNLTETELNCIYSYNPRQIRAIREIDSTLATFMEGNKTEEEEKVATVEEEDKLKNKLTLIKKIFDAKKKKMIR